MSTQSVANEMSNQSVGQSQAYLSKT